VVSICIESYGKIRSWVEVTRDHLFVIARADNGSALKAQLLDCLLEGFTGEILAPFPVQSGQDADPVTNYGFGPIGRTP